MGGGAELVPKAPICVDSGLNLYSPTSENTQVADSSICRVEKPPTL
jgi:hypothetical protein